MEYNNNIIGMGTLLIEHKLIHKLGKVGHIEDIVISQEYRGVGLGKNLIKQLMYIAEHDFKSYKVILNCSDLNIPFYESCGLFRHQNQMTFYFC